MNIKVYENIDELMIYYNIKKSNYDWIQIILKIINNINNNYIVRFVRYKNRNVLMFVDKTTKFNKEEDLFNKKNHDIFLYGIFTEKLNTFLEEEVNFLKVVNNNFLNEFVINNVYELLFNEYKEESSKNEKNRRI